MRIVLLIAALAFSAATHARHAVHFNDGYWIFEDGYWHLSNEHRGPWVVVAPDQVPYELRNLRPLPRSANGYHDLQDAWRYKDPRYWTREDHAAAQRHEQRWRYEQNRQHSGG